MRPNVSAGLLVACALATACVIGPKQDDPVGAGPATESETGGTSVETGASDLTDAGKAADGSGALGDVGAEASPSTDAGSEGGAPDGATVDAPGEGG